MTDYATPPAGAPPMGGPDEDEEARWDSARAHQKLVERQLAELRARHEARALFDRERAAAEQIPLFDAGLLSDILARPEEPAHRAEGLIPADAGTLIVAQRKTGKTTLQLNLARCLVHGGMFLGRFEVTPIEGRVAFLNFEVSAAQLARWAADVGVPSDRLFLVNLRGRRNPLGNPIDRATLATKLRDMDTESLIVDPFGRAYTGTSQNDPGEVGAWLAELDRFARGDVGARDVILAAHAGWSGERARGASALEDWADSIVKVTKDEQDSRYLSAEGRDIDVAEDQLTYDPSTRRLVMAGSGSRKATAKIVQVERLMPVVLDLLRDSATPTLSGNKLDEGIKALINSGDLDAKHSKGDGARAANLLEKRGVVVSKDGPRGARLFMATSPTSPNLPEGSEATSPTSPYRGVAQGTQPLTSPDSTAQETA